MQKLFVTAWIVLTTNLLHAQQRADSLKQLLSSETSISEKIDLSLSLYDELSSIDTLEAKKHLFHAVQLSDRADEKLKVKTSLKLVKYYRIKGKLSDAYSTLMKTDPCHRFSQDELCASYYNEHGVLHQLEGRYDSAVVFFLKALAIHEANGDTESSAILYNNLANIYWELEKLDDALANYQRALAIYEKTSNEKESSDVLGNIGLIYRSKNDYTKALEYYNRSLAIDRKYGNTLSEAINLQNIGALYVRTKDLDHAMQYMKESNALSRKIDDGIGVLYTQHGIASIYLSQEKYDEALKGFNEALGLARSLGIREDVKDLYESIAETHERKKDYNRALQFRKKFEAIKDSLSGEQYSNRIKELEVKYETEKKNQQIELLAKQNEVEHATSQRQATLKNAFIIVTILVSLLAIVITFALRSRLRNQKAFAAKTAELKEVSFRQQMTELEMKVLRAQINPHFLFNCMNSINHLILQNENENASRYLTRLSRLVRMILENSESGRVTLENELMLIESYIHLEELRFKGRINYQVQVDAAVEKQNTYLPVMILQPFVENAIWHGLMHKQDSRPGEIKIDIHEQGEILTCTIEDNGVGRARSKALQDSSVLKTKSLGIKITEERLKLLSRGQLHELIRFTDLKDASEQATGTRVEINIPLS